MSNRTDLSVPTEPEPVLPPGSTPDPLIPDTPEVPPPPTPPGPPPVEPPVQPDPAG